MSNINFVEGSLPEEIPSRADADRVFVSLVPVQGHLQGGNQFALHKTFNHLTMRINKPFSALSANGVDALPVPDFDLYWRIQRSSPVKTDCLMVFRIISVNGESEDSGIPLARVTTDPHESLQCSSEGIVPIRGALAPAISLKRPLSDEDPNNILSQYEAWVNGSLVGAVRILYTMIADPGGEPNDKSVDQGNQQRLDGGD